MSRKIILAKTGKDARRIFKRKFPSRTIVRVIRKPIRSPSQALYYLDVKRREYYITSRKKRR